MLFDVEKIIKHLKCSGLTAATFHDGTSVCKIHPELRQRGLTSPKHLLEHMETTCIFPSGYLSFADLRTQRQPQDRVCAKRRPWSPFADKRHAVALSSQSIADLKTL